MIFNQKTACRLNRPACFKLILFNSSSNNLFTIRKIFLLIFIISSTLIVQHVAEQSFSKRSSMFLNSFNQSPKATDHKDRLIPENNLNNLRKNPLVIQTLNGPVLGKRVKTLLKPSTNRVEEHDVDAFLGLPYGKAPINELRFQRPMPLDKSWNGYVFNATSQPDSCIQIFDTFFGEFRGSTMWNANTVEYLLFIY